VQPPPPQYGTPQYGTPQYGTPQYGTPQYGTPQYGTPQYGTPQYGYPPAGPYGYQTGWGQSFGSPPAPPGPRRPVRALGWIGIAAALIGVIGSRITWARIVGVPTRGVYVVDPVIDGREIGVGTVCLLLSVAIGILCGVLAWRTVLGCAIAVLCLGSLLLLIGGLNLVGVDRIAGPSVQRYGLEATIGAGLWMTFAAGLVASIAGLGATVRANGRTAPPTRWDAPTLSPYSPHP
jgi:hypothetical protein